MPLGRNFISVKSRRTVGKPRTFGQELQTTYKIQLFNSGRSRLQYREILGHVSFRK